ncbi:MAG: hypothetical protein U9Q15_03005 [Patescibacteria group bacterium]|nr:hypothetical protein [Patescibacteria group bacterium]
MKRQKLYTSLLENEITQRKSEYEDQVIDTVFFGGGTPSKMGVEFYQ